MHAIGTVTKSGGDDAHYKTLAEIRTLLLAAGWTQLRYDTVSANRELIVHSVGLSGTEDIFIGFRTYQSVPGDYYNIEVACMSGYISGNIFSAQPGFKSSGLPCHNNAVTYFLNADAGGIVGCFKIGTPIYSHFSVGKFAPYSRPGEYPSPLHVGAAFDGPEIKRFSEPNWVFPYYGRECGYSSVNSYLWIRDQTGTWIRRSHFPFYNAHAASAASSGNYALAQANYTAFGQGTLVPAGANYQPISIVLYDSNPVSGSSQGSIYGELRHVFQISGFNNGSENVMQVGGTLVDQTGLSVAAAVTAILAAGGRAMVVLQDNNRTDWRNFVALEMT